MSQSLKHTRTTPSSIIYQKMLQDQHSPPQEEPPSNTLTQSSQTQPSIQMVIEFGHNASASLLVGPHDDPLTLAKRFCFKHNIDPHVISTLSSNIRSLQNNSFNTSSFKFQKNNSFDDKENHNNSNHPRRSRSKSKEQSNQKSNIRISRNKPQSQHNQSITSSNPKQSARYNVFDRLYQDSKKKTIRAQHTNSKRTESSRLSLNKSLNDLSTQSCLQVYQKNTKLKQQGIRHSQYMHQLKQQKQVNNCSFQPQINPLSSLIATKLRELDQSSILNRSTNDKQMLKIKQYLLKKEKQEMKECTFKPQIINKLANSNQNPSQRCQKLYQDHLIRQSKKKLTQKHSQTNKHQPTINNISKVIVKKDFFQRLQDDTQKRLQKRLSTQKIDKEKNSQRRPSTGRAPANRNLGDKTIGEYLYQKSKISRGPAIKQQPQILTDPRSSQIHAKSKQIALQYIFQLLDHNQDGLISSTKINISALPEEVLKLLAPLLSEMEEVGVELNLQQFSTAFDRLYSTFSIEEKNIIIKAYKNKQLGSRASERPSFNPALNQYSLRIARQLCKDDTDIYQNSMIRMKEKENKLNRLRAERMLEDYSQCTFHPNIYQ